jgi:hypothetical protein
VLKVETSPNHLHHTAHPVESNPDLNQPASQPALLGTESKRKTTINQSKIAIATLPNKALNQSFPFLSFIHPFPSFTIPIHPSNPTQSNPIHSITHVLFLFLFTKSSPPPRHQNLNLGY